MRLLKFTDGSPEPKVAILIKESSFDEYDLKRYYVDPLIAKGIAPENIVACSLEYFQGKATASIIKDWIGTWLPSIRDSGVTHILCADSAYFKTLAKVPKAEAYLGSVIQCPHAGFESLNVIYSLGYGALLHNPNQEEKITRSIYALSTHYQGNYVAIGNDIIHSAKYPQTLSDIEQVLEGLKTYPELVVDIETFDLRLKNAGLASIGFATDKHNGAAFLCDYRPIPEDSGIYGARRDNIPVRKLLRAFFDSYQGKLIAHNASFDFKCLIHALWMEHPLDIKGMINGLEVLTRSFDDTKIIAYLALNSCAKQEYGLKKLAQPFAGNWAEEDIKDVRKIKPHDLLVYNLKDCLSTWYVKEVYEPIMIQDQQLEIYNSIMLPSLKTIIQMECHGVPLLPSRVVEVKAELLGMQKKCVDQLDSSEYVVYATDLLQERAWKEKQASLKKKIVQRHEFTEPLNFGSPQQLQVLLYEVMELPVIDFTDTKEPATGTKTLDKLINHAHNDDMRNCLKTLIELSKVNKILESFIPSFEDAWIKDDGYAYLHGSFNLGGTKSGRLSSSGPNLQQIPSKGPLGKLIKSCFVSPQGSIFAGADYNALEDRINTILTNDPNKVKIYSEGYDGHCFRAFYYWGDEMPDITYTVESINSIKDLYSDKRDKSKSPSFALQYQGTWITLMNNCGFSEEEAKKVEKNYHVMYEVSDAWLDAKLLEASKLGYAELAFGLRLRTPLLARTVMGSSMKANISSAEARTAGNALSGQSYGLLNCKATNDFMERVYASPHKYDIMPVMQIHDAQYYIFPDDVEIVKWVNDNLAECMSWQDLPELQHDVVKLGAEMDLFFPSWNKPITLKNNISIEEIYDTVSKQS